MSKLPVRITLAERAQIGSIMDRVRSSALSTPSKRFLLAFDATASREPTWEMAKKGHSDILRQFPGLTFQVGAYFGTDSTFSSWTPQIDKLLTFMDSIKCVGGYTQIHKMFEHAKAQNNVNTLMFVGDAMEEDEKKLYKHAYDLGKLGTPIFMLQEGNDEKAAIVYQEIARLSKGQYGKFASGDASTFQELLGAVASYVTGGMKALEQSKGGKLFLTKK